MLVDYDSPRAAKSIPIWMFVLVFRVSVYLVWKKIKVKVIHCVRHSAFVFVLNIGRLCLYTGNTYISGEETNENTKKWNFYDK